MLKKYWHVLKETIGHVGEKDVFLNAAALSYYTIFSLPPMLVVILFTATSIWNEQEVNQALFGQISNLVGEDGAAQISGTIDKLGLFDKSFWATMVGIGALLFTSTTVFVTIQGALNRIFDVRPNPEGFEGILKMVRDRVLSLGLLVGLGFILLVSLAINALIAAFTGWLQSKMPETALVLTTVLSIVVTLAIIALLFTGIFKILPDAKLRSRDAMVGGLFTAILFSIGKEAISLYIGQSNTANLYDAAGSVMVIMLWVFYASCIFLIGAVFTQQYAKMNNDGIPPSDYAVKVATREVVKEVGKEATPKK